MLTPKQILKVLRYKSQYGEGRDYAGDAMPMHEEDLEKIKAMHLKQIEENPIPIEQQLEQWREIGDELEHPLQGPLLYSASFVGRELLERAQAAEALLAKIRELAVVPDPSTHPAVYGARLRQIAELLEPK